jgi:hypothetical protein
MDEMQALIDRFRADAQRLVFKLAADALRGAPQAPRKSTTVDGARKKPRPPARANKAKRSRTKRARHRRGAK